MPLSKFSLASLLRNGLTYVRIPFTCIILFTTILFYACKEDANKERYKAILKAKIGDKLPFDSIKTAQVEGGTAVIVDEYWCYWIDASGDIFSVNGAAKSIMYDRQTGIPQCSVAPIQTTYSEILRMAE